MRCFTVSNLTVIPWLFVAERESRKTGGKFYAVEVGERGRGRELQFIPLHPKLEPQKGTFYGQEMLFIEEADIVETKSGRYVLVPAKGIDNLALIRVYGQEGYRGSLRYTFSGPERIIAKGYHAQGEAGRMGGGEEYLIVLHPGEVVEIKRFGRLYGSNQRVVIEWDGKELRVYDPDCEPDLEIEA